MRLPHDWTQRVASFWLRVCRNAWDFRGSVISGSRSAKRNAHVGGHPRSRHRLGLGADVVYDTRADCQRAWDAGRRDGLRGYKKSGGRSIHWQDRPAPAPVRARRV